MLISPGPSRAHHDDGFTMITVVSVMIVALVLSAAAFAAIQGDSPSGGRDADSKQARAAAEAGVQTFLAQLRRNPDFWKACGVATPGSPPDAVNQRWDGTGTDPRDWLPLATGATAQYSVEMLPVAPATQCNPAAPETSMLDTNGNFRIRATGRARGDVAGRPPAQRRSLIATFRSVPIPGSATTPKGPLDYLWFTDTDQLDPMAYRFVSFGLPTRENLRPGGGPRRTYTEWGEQECASRYYRNGRGAQRFNGSLPLFAIWWNFSGGCAEATFDAGDEFNGPMHTNDEFQVCDGPIFGRTSSDDIATGASGVGVRPCYSGASGPQMRGTLRVGAAPIQLPRDNAAMRQGAAVQVSGRANIRLLGRIMTINGVPRPIPAGGVIAVNNRSCTASDRYNALDPYPIHLPWTGCGTAWVQGTSSVDVTIAAEHDIVIWNDIRRTSDALIGLSATNFVRVYHPVTGPGAGFLPFQGWCNNQPGWPQNRRVEAAIVALNHTFVTDNPTCGTSLGDLEVLGAVAQRYHGGHGVFYSKARSGGGWSYVSGYRRKFTYDPRLSTRLPPAFPVPSPTPGPGPGTVPSPTWQIKSQTEQTPPL